MFEEYSKSKSLAFLNQSIGSMYYDNLDMMRIPTFIA